MARYRNSPLLEVLSPKIHGVKMVQKSHEVRHMTQTHGHHPAVELALLKQDCVLEGRLVLAVQDSMGRLAVTWQGKENCESTVRLGEP